MCRYNHHLPTPSSPLLNTKTKPVTRHQLRPSSPSRPASTSVSTSHHSDAASSLQGRLPWWEGGGCGCEGGQCDPTHTHPMSASNVGGTCGWRAWEAGGGQRVVSLTLYGDNPEFWLGLHDILTQVQLSYPGWSVWLYTDPQVPGRASVLCPLLQRHPHLYLCDVTALTGPLANLSHNNPRMWRIAPLGDPQVSAILFRDTDSKITDREVSAVREWLESGQQFHLMRDHPLHTVPVMAGLWGARWEGAKVGGERRGPDPGGMGKPWLSAGVLTVLRDTMLSKTKANDVYYADQKIIYEVLWGGMVGRVMAHDSYWCGTFENNTQPWPTQRRDGRFVGYRGYRKKFADERVKEKCPRECRPHTTRTGSTADEAVTN